MKISVKVSLIAMAMVVLGALSLYLYPDVEEPSRAPSAKESLLPASPSAAAQASPQVVETPKSVTVQTTRLPDTHATAGGQQQAAHDPEWSHALSDEETAAPDTVDPVHLGQAELELVNNQIYEEVAQETLPILSIQTHNPVWVLEDAATDAAGINKQDKRSGPFGTNIQPEENEIWLRIPAAHANEHREIMAENADLYRSETGTNESVTVTLWVGGRPYYRQQYE